MTLGTLIFVMGFMSPSALCLIYAWRAQIKLGMNSIDHGWRAGLLMVGLVLASLSQLLATSFLLVGFRLDEQSFAKPVSLPWAIANWTTLLTWILALVMVAVGSGRIRRPLLIWGLVMPGTSWIIVMMGYDY
jgi:hypothetical protein